MYGEVTAANALFRCNDLVLSNALYQANRQLRNLVHVTLPHTKRELLPPLPFWLPTPSVVSKWDLDYANLMFHGGVDFDPRCPSPRWISLSHVMSNQLERTDEPGRRVVREYGFRDSHQMHISFNQLHRFPMGQAPQDYAKLNPFMPIYSVGAVSHSPHFNMRQKVMFQDPSAYGRRLLVEPDGRMSLSNHMHREYRLQVDSHFLQQSMFGRTWNKTTSIMASLDPLHFEGWFLHEMIQRLVQIQEPFCK